MLSTRNIFKKVSDINRCDQDTVFGFIRRIQRLVKNKRIPLVIEYICLLFFYETDRFGDSKITIKSRFSMMYGMMHILDNEYSRKFLYQWRFKYCNNNKDTKSILQFGITDEGDSRKLFWNYRIRLSTDGRVWKFTPMVRINYVPNLEKWNSRSKWILSNDEIIMSMDIEKKKMEYVIQRSEDSYYFYDNISIEFPTPDQKYRMFVCHHGKDNEIKIKLTAFIKVPRTSDKTHKELIKDQIERIKCEEVKKSIRGIIKL